MNKRAILGKAIAAVALVDVLSPYIDRTGSEAMQPLAGVQWP
jgi:hypothetical protein